MTMNGVRRCHTLACFVALAVSILATPPTGRAQQRGYDQSLLKGLQWRSIGPYRGGRATAGAGVSSQPKVYFFGATGGGVWKTTDGGINWDAISDEYFKTGSVGAIGVAESDPNVIYVGMGEVPIRGNFSHGD
ncbi:MAG TPA: glycosyl hydrolase, partial [Blastocatellia bacterium]|nr:glycosyl hydrolase [Blastocatellia bacterium]